MVAVLVMTACHNKKEMAMTGGALPVEVAIPAVRDVMLTREYPGYLSADATISVVGRVNGTIVKRTARGTQLSEPGHGGLDSLLYRRIRSKVWRQDGLGARHQLSQAPRV